MTIKKWLWPDPKLQQAYDRHLKADKKPATCLDTRSAYTRKVRADLIKHHVSHYEVKV